jgi:uncharacterized iron-regulated membrane protein
MASTLSGLYLWWPRGRQIGQAVRVAWSRSGKRRTFDLHRASGFWIAAVLLTLAVSGVALVFPALVRGLVTAVAVTDPRPPAPRSVPRPGTAPLGPDEAAARAVAGAPGATLAWLDCPGEETGAYRAWLRRPGDVRAVYGDVNVWIDQWSGAILGVRDRDRMPVGEGVLHWQFPLHSGEAFGLPGRLLVCAAGLAPSLLLVTGVLIWRRKRRAAAPGTAGYR